MSNDERQREEGMRNRGWERPWGGNVEGAGEISAGQNSQLEQGAKTFDGIILTLH